MLPVALVLLFRFAMQFTPLFSESDPLSVPSIEPLVPLSELTRPEDDPLVRALEGLQGNEHDASRWLEVARAFCEAKQPIQAIDACEACLKVDPKQIDAWFLIAELATVAGHLEMANDSYAVVRQLAPEDPRLPALSSQS